MENEKTTQKSFENSTLTLQNRKSLDLTGVEKVYEASETKVQMRVAGSNLSVLGSDLSITKIDVDAGNLNMVGKIDDIKFLGEDNRQNIFKRIFKWYFFQH